MFANEKRKYEKKEKDLDIELGLVQLQVAATPWFFFELLREDKVIHKPLPYVFYSSFRPNPIFPCLFKPS